MSSAISEVEALLSDVANRAAKTFLQAGSATAAAQWAAAGLDKGHLVDFSSVERAVASVVVGFGAGGASAVWNLAKGYWNARKGKVVADIKVDASALGEDIKPMAAGLLEDAK
jgi:hypothetical protein